MDRDKRLKEIEKAGAIEGAQMAQNEIASMAQEQRNNLLQEKQVISQQAQERALINQAAEMGMMNAEEASNNIATPQQQPTLNAQTQQLLSKYGINPNQKSTPQSKTTTRSTTKQGPTTVENITNTTTTNHNVVRVIQPNIPISKPNIQMRSGSSIRFKTWLQKANAQQEELANSQLNDYNKRERNIIRSTNAMMRKLQDLSKSIGTSLDPENMTNTVSGSLKTMLYLFIATMIPIVWKPLMEKVSTFEANFRSFFGMDLPGDLKGRVSERIPGWKKALGIDEEDVDKVGVPGAALKLIQSSFSELLEKIKLDAEDRKKAVERVSKDMPTEMLDIGGWMQYLGKVIVAAIGGSEGQAKFMGNEITKEKVNEIEKEEFTLEGKKISMLGEFDENGELRNEDSALKLTQSLANETGKEEVDINKVQASIEKLKSFSSKQDKLIPLSPEFVEKISQIVPEEKISELIKKYQDKGEYKINDTDYVFTIRKSDYDPSSEYSIWDRIKEWSSAGIDKGTKAGAVAGAAAGALPTAGFGIVAGGGIGYMLGGLVGGLGGAAVGLGHGIKDAVTAHFKAPGGQLSLVPLSSLSEKEKRNLNFHKNYAKASVEMVSPQFISELFGMAGNKNSFSSENYNAISKTFLNKGKKIKTTNKEYLDVVNSSLKVKEKKAALDTENTQTNRVAGTADLSKPVKDHITIEAKTDSEPKKKNVFPPADKNKTAKTIIDYLKEKLGLTHEQASGVAGNLYVESDGFKLNAEGDNKTSFGLAQWHNERKEALFKYTGTSENNPPTLEQQLDYLAHELTSSEKSALLALKKTSTVKDSAYVFAKKFERPATGSDGYPLHFDKRWGYAESFYKLNTSPVPDQQRSSVSADFVETKKDRLTNVDIISSNMSIIDSNKIDNDLDQLKNIVENTKKLAEISAISAELDAIPRQNVSVNVSSPAQSHPQQVGWGTPI